VESQRIKQALGAVSFEKYVQKGTLPRCLPEGMSFTLEQAKAAADEVWGDGDAKVFSFNYDGYSVNITFSCDNAAYLFDSVDIWSGAEGGASELGHLYTLEGARRLAGQLGINLLWFQIEDEYVGLFPSAVTVHYLRHVNQWKLVKAAGAYRRYEDVFASLKRMANVCD